MHRKRAANLEKLQTEQSDTWNLLHEKHNKPRPQKKSLAPTLALGSAEFDLNSIQKSRSPKYKRRGKSNQMRARMLSPQAVTDHSSALKKHVGGPLTTKNRGQTRG